MFARSRQTCLRVCIPLLFGVLLSACQTPEQRQQLDQLNSSIEAIEARVVTTQTMLEANLSSQQAKAEEEKPDELAPLHAQLSELNNTLPAQVTEAVRNLVQQVCQPTLPEPQSCLTEEVETLNDRLVVGEVETVRVEPPGFEIEARIDTGAESSSLHAENVTEFERDGEAWVKFDVVSEEVSVTLERPVQKYVRVIQQSDKEGTRRPVVLLRLLVGTIKDSFEFTLADRSHLAHHMILGRNFLTDLAVVDVGRQNIQPLPPEDD